jgi:outer membrane receptor protein involved in Fe transport
MRSIFTLIVIIFFWIFSFGQSTDNKQILVKVLTESRSYLHDATVFLLNGDSSVVKNSFTDASGTVLFNGLTPGNYFIQVRLLGFKDHWSSLIDLVTKKEHTETIVMISDQIVLQDVTVTSKKPLIQFLPEKTVINVEASITNAGTTVMEVLEKSPGITVGRDGTINMKGKPSVMVLIDGKQTQLSGSELQAYLSGISSSQIETIELIDNPGAKYDAAGNAGIINIKTKTNKQRGFNGSLSLSIGQGFYWKNNNSINLNYRNGKFNIYVNHGVRLGYEMMNLYALRKYFDKDGNDSLLLEQPNFTKTKITSHNLKTGVDFFAGKKTTLGAVFTGNLTDRNIFSKSSIDWMSPNHEIDSTINTRGTRNIKFQRAGINLNAKHNIDENTELLADVDLIKFDITGDQFFQTQLEAPASVALATKGDLPSELKIFTAKFDYSKRINKALLEAGVKTARTNTDNLTQYYFYDGNVWKDDLSRSNHFLYDERIHSAYGSVDVEKGKWHWRTGLRYELTDYKANQLGNTVVKDSAFRKNYGSLFPSGFASYNIDSNNSITFRFGRRIDRPQFQNLNPFLVTINKYTFEGGNPFIKPQYTWNFELIHTYKQILSTAVSYSYLKDYFSQIFIIDSNSSNVNKNIIIYTRGNVGTFHNIGLTASLQLPITKWWTLTSVAVYNHKIIKGVVYKAIRADVDQLNVSINNQFRFKKGWAAEISGYYLTNSQIDLQESLTPQGEAGVGVSKQILKNKGTLRLNIRDFLYTQNYSGYSHFQNSDEPFKVKWDSRVVRLTFNWRFGKAMKAIKRSGGGSDEETNRVGTGN